MKLLSVQKVLLAVTFLSAALCSPSAFCDQEESIPQITAEQSAADSTWQNRIVAERNKVSAAAGENSSLETSTQIGRMLEGLGYCLAVFLIAFHLYKKFHARVQGSSKRNLRVIESIPLSPKTFLHLVEVNNRRLLVSSGQQNVNFVKLDDDMSFDVSEFNGTLKQAAASSQVTEDQIC